MEAIPATVSSPPEVDDDPRQPRLQGEVDALLASLNQMLCDGDAILTRHTEVPNGEQSSHSPSATFENAIVKPKPEQRPPEPLRPHRPRYKRGSIPPDMMESILQSRNAIVDANKFNEGLWNLSGIPMSRFNVQYTEFLLVELMHDVQNEIGKAIDDAVDDVVNFEVGPPP